MRDDQLARRLLCGRYVKAFASERAQQMLHTHRLACAKQAAIQNRMQAFIGLQLVALRQVKAPRLDAFLPIAPGKSHVLHAICACVARAHEVGVAACLRIFFSIALRRLR